MSLRDEAGLTWRDIDARAALTDQRDPQAWVLMGTAARLLGVHRATLSLWAKEGRIEVDRRGTQKRAWVKCSELVRMRSGGAQ